MLVYQHLEGVRGSFAQRALRTHVESRDRHEDVKTQIDSNEQRKGDLPSRRGLTNAIEQLGHHHPNPEQPQDAPDHQCAPRYPLRNVVEKTQVRPRLRAKEREHGPPRELLQTTADAGHAHEHPRAAHVATSQEKAHTGKDKRTQAIERRERTPDEAHATLHDARAHEHPSLLKQEAGHGADCEDEHALVPAVVHDSKVLFAGCGMGAAHLLALPAR